MKINKIRIKVFGIGIILFGKIIFAQQVDQLTRMRIAESYTDAGDWEHALPIYESLYKEQPDNYIFFDKLRTCYVQLKKYENAIRITERRLSAQPKDGYLMTQLGGLYYRKGDERKADSLWMLVLKMEPKNANSFRMVAMEMYEHRLYERAIIVYKEARKALNNPALFADDLAGLFAALQQYGNATKEFVQIIRANPQQLIYIQSRFSQFTQKEGGLKEAISVVRQEVETNPNDITVRQLLGWLYMEGKNFEAALDEYTVIEKLSKSGGNELFNFGKRAFQEKQYLIAERTFKRITEGFVASNVYPFARFERARAIEERAGETDSSSRSAFIQEGIEAATYQYAISVYELIMKEISNSDLYAKSLYRIGIIQMMRLFDLNSAKSSFEGVRKNPRSGTLLIESAFNIAEINLQQNYLEQSRIEYSKLLYFAPEYLMKSRFRLAELDYFETHFDSALSKLQQITVETNQELTNDALELLYFIQENKGNSRPLLEEFARAELALRQRKLTESLNHFKDLENKSKDAPLYDDVLMKIGEIQLKLGNSLDAITAFSFIADSLEQSILRDRALMRIAEVYQFALREPVKATRAYEQLLARFPSSLHTSEARKRIRFLRGDAI